MPHSGFVVTRAAFLALFSFGSLRSCFSSSKNAGNFIRGFGTFASPYGKKKIEVTRRQKSLVDFKVLDVASGKELVKDYVGSDVMRWFLFWETPDVLWGYGSDIGYFKCFEFTTAGVKETKVQAGMEVPQEVWDNLPNVMQKRVKSRQPKQ